MARLAADEKLLYYPAAPQAIDALLRHLGPPADPGRATLLDPCAGEGKAWAQLAAGLGLPAGGAFAVELDAYRADRAREALPGATVQGPCSFLATRITYNSFSLVYCNPPFSDELGGGARSEETFAWRCTNLLAPGGVLALVLPLGTWQTRNDLRSHLEASYEDSEVFAFPEACRPYKEICFLGRRRRAPLAREECDGRWVRYWQDRAYGGFEDWPVLGTGERRWALPPGRPPKLFEKLDYTPEELAEVVARSPVNRVLAPPPPRGRPSPPLSLGEGHIALLLASGHLDGLVRPPGGEAHVVRGTARKERYLKESSESENEDGSVTTKDVYAERVVVMVRAVDSTGVIRTFE